MKKLILSVASLALLSIVSALAIPAKPGAVSYRQSDGTIITIETFGDEFCHYTLVDGTYTVMQKNDGDFYYATMKEGNMVASDVKVVPSGKLTDAQRRVANMSVGLRPSINNTIGRYPTSANDVLARMSAESSAATRAIASELKMGRWGGTRTGKMKGLAILVEYTDVKFQNSATANAEFTDKLNQEGYSKNGATGSARDYFIANSNGKFDPEFVVVGPYTLPNNRAYYGENNSYGNDMRPAMMVLDACNLAERDGLDFSQFDGNSDGEIDLVFVFFAGNNEAESGGGFASAIWPHMSYITPKGPGTNGNIDSDVQPVFDGKKLYTYACSSELRGAGKEISGIGSFCHEFGHAIGLPDTYDTDGDTNGKALGLQYADIMSAGNYLNEGRTPPAYNILERWMLGWAKPAEITEAGEYTLEPLYGNNGFIIYADEEHKEFFLFENHNPQANSASFGWDKYLLEGDPNVDINGFQGGNGMLVYHVDTNTKYLARWDRNQANAYADHQCIKLFRAVESAPNSQSRKWFFPGDGNVTALTDKTTPQFCNWEGVNMSLKIANIAQEGQNILLTVLMEDLSYEVHQYDALIDWSTSKYNYTSWKVVYTSEKSGESFSVQCNDKFAVLGNLTPRTEYAVQIYAMENGVESENALYTFHITTLGTSGIASLSRSALNMQATYNKSDYIWLSVKDLDCTPANIDWYIDGEKSDSIYLKLASGKHQICAVVTDTEGNTEYLYRQITVK